MKAVALLLFPLCLSACSGPVGDAEEQLRIVKDAHGSKRDICLASKKLEAAYLADHDEAEYGRQHARAEVDCVSADLEDEHPG